MIVRARGKMPWSFAGDRSAHFDEIARRASERGLPEVRYPEGWPRDTYSLLGLRAAMLAEDQDQLRAVSRELFTTMFVEGRHLADLDAVLDAAERAGVARGRARTGVEDPQVKDQLRRHTDEALERGVTGVPTVALGDQLFWGDDRLEEAAAAGV